MSEIETTKTTVPSPGEAICKAALWNTFTVCQFQLAGRTHATGVDIRLFEGMWQLLLRNFATASAETHPTIADYIPQTQVQQPLPDLLIKLEQALTPRETTPTAPDVASASEI